MARFRCLTLGLALAALLTIAGTAAADPVPITSGHLSIGGTGFLTNGCCLPPGRGRWPLGESDRLNEREGQSPRLKGKHREDWSAEISERRRVLLASLLVRLAGEPLERLLGPVHQCRRKALIRLERIAGRKHDVSRTHHELEI